MVLIWRLRSILDVVVAVDVVDVAVVVVDVAAVDVF